LWDLNGAAPRERELNPESAYDRWPLVFPPGKGTLLTGTGRFSIEGWDLTKAKPWPVKLVNEKREWDITAVAPSLDRERVGIGRGGNLEVWDLGSDKLVQIASVTAAKKSGIFSVALAGNTVVSLAYNSNEFAVWRLENGNLLERPTQQAGLVTIDLSLTP